jgi:hypothetical protein
VGADHADYLIFLEDIQNATALQIVCGSSVENFDPGKRCTRNLPNQAVQLCRDIPKTSQIFKKL